MAWVQVMWYYGHTSVYESSWLRVVLKRPGQSFSVIIIFIITLPICDNKYDVLRILKLRHL